jgi:hypothetical protein
LILVFNGTILNNNEYVSLQFNGDTGSNYSNVYMTNLESGASTTTSILRAIGGTTNCTIVWQLMDFSATNKHKMILSRSGTTPSLSVWASAERWANTNAITTVRVFSGSSNLSSGSTFTLYGVIA